MNNFRDSIAATFRTLPSFRGKSHVGVLLNNLLTQENELEDIRAKTVRMKDGTLMQLDPRSRTERWAYWTGEYDRKVISALIRLLDPNSTVLDVGANVGFYSVAIAHQLRKSGGKVYAFEPVSSNFASLKESIRLNQLEDVVSPYSLALGEEEGEMEISMEVTNGSRTGNAVLVQGGFQGGLGKNSKIEVSTLDKFSDEHQINSCQLIKVDIEGAELDFLKGGINFISHHRPIIYGEFNSYWMNQFGDSLLDVFDLFEPLGYCFYRRYKNCFNPIEEKEAGLEDILLFPQERKEEIVSRL